MTRENKYLFTYLASIISLLLLRICFFESVFGEMLARDEDILFSILAQVLCMGIIPVLGMFLAGRKEEKFSTVFTDRLYFKSVKGGKLWIAIIILAILHPIINSGVSTVWSTVVRLTGFTPTLSDTPIYFTFGEFFVAFLLTAIAPAFFEEITNRGLVLSSSGGSVHKRVLLSGLLFALMHQNVMQTGYTFVGGVMMAYLVAYTGSIFPAMLVHFFNNFIVVLRYYSSSYNGLVYKAYVFFNSLATEWWGMLILGVVWVIAVTVTVYILYKMHKRHEEENREDISSVVCECKKSDKILARTLWIAIITIGALSTISSYVWGLLR